MTVWTEMGNEGCTKTDAISFLRIEVKRLGKLSVCEFQEKKSATQNAGEGNHM